MQASHAGEGEAGWNWTDSSRHTLKAFSFWRENGNILESRFKTLTYILHVKSLKIGYNTA